MKLVTTMVGVFLASGSGFEHSVAQEIVRHGPSETRTVRRDGKVYGTLYWFGVPMPGATIFLENGSLEKTFVTDAHGFYMFKAPPGRYFVTAPGPWASEAFRTEIVVLEKGEAEVLDFWFW
jgi:hypothetical protein